MKKPIILTAVLSTAALMTAMVPAFSFQSMAQTTGWVQEQDNWKFYDSDGYQLTDTWKKQDGSWFYLNEDGNLAFNQQIDEYYVGSDGRRVMNQWVSIANEDHWDMDDAPEFHWYYYGKDGKAMTSRFKAIEDNWYYFDGEGRMMTGLADIDGATYYFGDHTDGVMKKGWIELEISNDDPDDESAWFYFDSDGKMIENQVDKKINGSYYTFENGKMVTGWYKLPQAADTLAATEDTTAATPSDASSEAAASAEQSAPLTSADGYQYYDETGKRASGWMTIEGIPGLSDEYETYKFYFKNGQPYFAQTGIQVFGINSSKYGFNTKGEMQTGLQVVTLEDGSTANFYFDENGSMQVGKQTIVDEESGSKQTWYFHTEGAKKGQGYHGILNNVIYEYGLRKEADADLRYMPVTFQEQKYLVNTSGTIQKATASSNSSSRPELGSGYKDVKDTNDTIWTVDVNGIIQ